VADVVEKYLHDLSQIRSSGSAVVEPSSYGTLETLFNEIAKTLKLKIRCIINQSEESRGTFRQKVQG